MKANNVVTKNGRATDDKVKNASPFYTNENGKLKRFQPWDDSLYKSYLYV